MNHTPCAKRVNPWANTWEIAWVVTCFWNPLFARFLCSQSVHFSFSLNLDVFTKLRNMTIRFYMFVCPYGTTQLPLDGFSWDLIFGYFPKNCPENSSFIKLRQVSGTLHEDQYTFLILCLLVLRMQIVSDKSCRDNQERHSLFNSFFRHSCCLWGNVEKYCRGHRWQYDACTLHVGYLSLQTHTQNM